MKSSKEILIPQSYDEYFRAVHTALLEVVVEMYQRTEECGKFATKEGGINGYTRQRRDCTQFGLVRFVENALLISIEKNIIRFIGII